MQKGFSRVGKKLWVSGLPPSDLKHRGFDVLVLCAIERQAVQADIHILKVPLDDSETPEPRDRIRHAYHTAGVITDLRKQGRRVLVTCRMGVNRSAFVAALSLMIGDGHSAAQAIEQIREFRGTHTLPSYMPLSNMNFVNELLQIERQLKRRAASASVSE